MNKIKNKLILIIMLIALSGCTDAKIAKFGSLGSKHHIQLYSGGKMVKEWTSTGKVSSQQDSDGYYFEEKDTGKLIEVSGDVVITRL